MDYTSLFMNREILNMLSKAVGEQMNLQKATGQLSGENTEMKPCTVQYHFENQCVGKHRHNDVGWVMEIIWYFLAFVSHYCPLNLCFLCGLYFTVDVPKLCKKKGVSSVPFWNQPMSLFTNGWVGAGLRTHFRCIVSHSPALPRPHLSPSWHTRYVSAACLPRWGQSAGRTHARIRSAHRPCLRPHPPAPQTKRTPLPRPLHPRLPIRRAT